MQKLQTISPQQWPLRNLYKNITGVNDVLAGHPAADEIQLDGTARPFVFRDNDKNACLSILLRMIILQKMGMAADKFPSSNLVNQAISEFITLFENLGNTGELYWLLNGVCWLRLLRANSFNSNHKYPANLALTTNDLQFADRDSIVEQYYKSLSVKVLGKDDPRIFKKINKQETKLKSLFSIMSFMDAGNFLLIVPQNLALCVIKLRQAEIVPSIIFAVTTLGIYLVDRNEQGKFIIAEGVLENRQSGNLVCYLLYTGDGGDTVLTLYRAFYKTFPSRLENIIQEFYTMSVQMVDPEKTDDIKDVMPMVKAQQPVFTGPYAERARLLYKNI